MVLFSNKKVITLKSATFQFCAKEVGAAETGRFKLRKWGLLDLPDFASRRLSLKSGRSLSAMD